MQAFIERRLKSWILIYFGFAVALVCAQAAATDERGLDGLWAEPVEQRQDWFLTRADRPKRIDL